jgi:hypothetical protein
MRPFQRRHAIRDAVLNRGTDIGCDQPVKIRALGPGIALWFDHRRWKRP